VKEEVRFDPFELPLGETIYRLRTSKEISHADIQRATGIHRNTLLRIERGERPPSVAVLHTIAKVLGIETWRIVMHAQKASPDATIPQPGAPIKPFHIREKERKDAARQTLNGALKSGKMFREPCEVCGSINTEGHHEDYSKPLNVIWLCRVHHNERHRAIDCARLKIFCKG